MKTHFFVAIAFATIMHTAVGAPSSAKMVRKDLSVEKEKTTEEVIQTELQCIRHSRFGDMLQDQLPNGVQYLRDQLAMGTVENKKYYINVSDTHNIMYFRHGDCIFIHVNRITNQGEDRLKLRAFISTDFDDCIRVLPESCVWQGEREVKYVEICESGLDLSEGIKMDVFKVNILEENGLIKPIDVWEAVRECYQPNVYSVAFECFKKGLWFDPNQARNYMKRVNRLLQKYKYDTVLNMEKYEIEYSKLKVVATLNGETVGVVDPDA